MIFSFLLHHPILHDASGRSLDFEQSSESAVDINQMYIPL
jgi:hypothetical protein